MKEIKAYIKPHRLDEVTLALKGVKGLGGMSVMDACGFGRSTDNIGDFIPHTRIEIVCRDGLVDEIVSVIEKAAHTGLKGDGIIYVTDVREVVRIETGERGEEAI